jgi:hypothetical protein
MIGVFGPDVCGTYDRRPFVFSQGVFTALPESPGHMVLDINHSWQIVGWDVSGGQGFLLENGEYTPLNGRANSINNSGTIAGGVSAGAYILSGGVYTIFGSGSYTEAFAINELGETAGIYTEAGGSPYHGFVRSTAATIRFVDYPGLNVPGSGIMDMDIYGLNSAGMVGGSYYDSNGRYHGFIATPTSPADATGPQGPKGDKGDTGATGVQGQKGDKGDTGATGAQGLNGDTGATGAQGPQGAAGPSGPTGSTGAAGASGPQGLLGPMGVPGATGPQGLRGPAGPAGSQSWSTYIPLFNTVYTASTFTPTTPITLTRLQLQLGLAPVGCTRNAVLRISDGTVAGTKTILVSAAANDSGVLAVNYSAGIPVTIGVSVTAACTGIPPVNANAVAQYHAQ